ncbi:MAG: acetyl-CoA acetyltransferase [Candidatus Tectomicrobia bacterium]|nr:acetyl-CoA acetyltransferase [Candidatus Tectomicrobia bacterium]
MGISGNVAIIGVGTTRFGENFRQGYVDMLVEACRDAFADAGVDGREMQAAWLGTYLPYAWGFEGVAGTTLAEALNLYPIPVTRVSNYCTTGMEAVRYAALAVASGEYDVALAAGGEKMRDVGPRDSLVAQHVEKGHPFYCKGRTAPGAFALLARRYFEVYDASEEVLARVAVKNHRHGALNPKAHFRKEITIEQVLRAPRVAEPLGLLDCCPTTDGAAAVVLTRTELARRAGKPHVVIRGTGLSCAAGYFTMPFEPDYDFLGFESTRQAARAAYAQAGIARPRDQIDVAEVHDCFTITEVVNYEDLGFCGRGEGGGFVAAGAADLEGELPVNPSGGLKSCGHPIGATGARMIAEITDQLLGRAGRRQVKEARVGLAHTLGGPGAVACVFVLERG